MQRQQQQLLQEQDALLQAYIYAADDSLTPVPSTLCNGTWLEAVTTTFVTGTDVAIAINYGTDASYNTDYLRGSIVYVAPGYSAIIVSVLPAAAGEQLVRQFPTGSTLVFAAVVNRGPTEAGVQWLLLPRHCPSDSAGADDRRLQLLNGMLVLPVVS